MTEHAVRLGAIGSNSVLQLDDYLTWCGSVIRGEQDTYHLFFSMWARHKGHEAWVTDSVVGHASSKSPLGPYLFDHLALRGSGQAQGWDRDVIHNPTVKKFGSRYYMYYTGNFGNGEYWNHRNHQRIGVAVADDPAGEWQRFDQPLLDVNPDGWDCLLTTNPSVTQMPDKRFLLLYKAVGKVAAAPMFGPVLHGVAFSDSPTGPFIRHPHPILAVEGVNFPGEDPYVFCRDGKLYAILKDMGRFYTSQERALVQFESEDGIHWTLSSTPLFTSRKMVWSDGRQQEFHRLERPQLYLDEGGDHYLYCAVKPEADKDDSFNIHVKVEW